MDSRIQGETWNYQTFNNIKTYIFHNHKVDKIQEVWDIKEKIENSTVIEEFMLLKDIIKKT